MDWSAFIRTLDAYNLHLFAIGTTEITVFTLVKFAIWALLLWFVAGRFSRWTLDRLLGRTHMQEGQRLAIADQSFITSNVTNYSYLKAPVRLRVPVPVAPGQDVRRIETLMLEAAKQAELLADPVPQVAIASVAASAVTLELWAWCDSRKATRSEVLSKAYFAILDALSRNDVKLAS